MNAELPMAPQFVHVGETFHNNIAVICPQRKAVKRLLQLHTKTKKIKVMTYSQQGLMDTMTHLIDVSAQFMRQ